jgi:sterol desaturase/sphingolipid hydroxylase (fatty acid hydroxylase superfamily)
MLNPAFLKQLASLAANFLLVLVVFVPLEKLFAARRQKILRPAFWTDFGYFVISGLVPKLLLILPLSALAWVVHRAAPSAYFTAIGSLPLSIRLIAALVVGEIGYYWGHRLSHEIPFLWRFHAIHHAAERMDWLVNTRGHPLDITFGHLCGLIPLYVLGLAQPLAGKLDLVPQLFALIGSLWGFFIHANVNWRFGPLESVVATPAFHHWHHTNDGPDVIDKNYSSMLPWVDRLFGTFYLPRYLPENYGINAKIPGTLTGQLLHPLRSDKEKAGLLF